MSEPARPVRPQRPWPDRPAARGELIERLNREWQLAPPAPQGGSLGRRLAAPLRRLVAALLRPQEAFNSALVQRINDLALADDVSFARQESLRAMAEDIFFRTEVLFDRIEAHARRMDGIGERIDAVAGSIDVRFATLTADVEALDDYLKSTEASAARERRLHDAVLALREEHAEIRTAVGVLRHESQQLAKRIAAPVPVASPPAGAPPVAVAAVDTSDALSHKYVGFEDEFRGSAEAIRAGLEAYVPLFAGASNVLDVGCGRGEFLALLRDAGVSARGIDLNESMVQVCRERGLDADVADALTFLRQQPDGSLGGLFAAQVVEHLRPGYLTQLLDVAYEKLAPGAVIVLETINPACWFAFFSSYIRDITHERALHPDTLKFLMIATGFERVEIRYSAPYPEHDKLQPLVDPALPADTVDTLNANVERLNGLLFTYLDYAAIGAKARS